MRHKFVILSVLAVLSLLAAGCMSRPSGGATAAMAGEDELAIDLPFLVIDFDANGDGSVGGVGLGELIGGSGINIGADTVGQMQAANIQHVSLEVAPNGVLIRVNGLLMLGSLSYDDESLDTLAMVIDDLGGAGSPLGGMAPTLGAVLPLVQNLGIGVITKFEPAAGADAIPVMQASAMDPEYNVARWLLSDVEQTPTINVPIFIDADGAVTIGGLNAAAMEALGAAQSIPVEQVATITGMGINQLRVRTLADGLSLSVNGNDLPLLSTSSGELFNVLDLLQSMPGMEGMAESLQLAALWAQVVNEVDAVITITFS